MKKQTITKITSGLIIFVFVVSFFQFTIPAQAATNLPYSNPNQGNSTYKFKISDVVNSNLLTSVVGCTGVVNKVSTWMLRFVQSPKQAAKATKADIEKLKNQLRNACAAGKAALEAVVGAIPFVNNLTSTADTASETVKWCTKQVDTLNDQQIAILQDAKDTQDEVKTKEQCLDGIAMTLAKNQLTAMTRSAMNWVNTGFGGNPFFVQNMRNLTNNIERNVIETGTDILLNDAFGSPYSRDFARATVTSNRYGNGVGSGVSGLLGGLQSDLSSFVSDPRSYYTDSQLNQAEDTRTALQMAQDANYSFQNDFSVGGWDGYMALTQRDQNNPLGFNMMASQFITDTQTKQITQQQNELAQNNGFLSQKTCILWQWFDKEGKPLTNNPTISAKSAAAGLKTVDVFVYKPNKSTTTPNFDVCIDWKTTTPGSIIRDKTTNYLNSPERQLELAKTINDSLNALFSVLISKLEGGGLSGLSDSTTNNSNWTDNFNSNYTSPDGNTTYDNNGAYDGFNLTRDLGNTYIHDTTYNAGTWDANSQINQTSKTFDHLISGYVPPIYDNTNQKIDSNIYWTVTNKGDTRLIENGYNGWEVGDRAFWNGYEWQNWKKGQESPIKNRGVIQIQQDYVVAANEILKVLPNVMPKLGELDYCLPGPNPNYKSNSTDAQSAYQAWIGSMYVGPRDSNRDEWRIDHENTPTYDTLKAIFVDNSRTWSAVLSSSLMKMLNDFDRSWIRTSNEGTIAGQIIGSILGGGTAKGKAGDCYADHGDGNSRPPNCQNYHWHRDGKSLDNQSQDDVDNRKALMESTLDFVNNHLFQDFYKLFDDQMNTNYFKKMTSKYLDTETSISEVLNPAYIDMAASGFSLTKNITFYNDEINASTKEYKDAIAQAKINISKLEVIRNEVSKIILAAQARRDDNLVKIINAEKVKMGRTDALSPAAYKKEYASCLDEENIQVYDAGAITNSNYSAERCFNGIDDDLNGLIDSKDPACSGAGAPSTPPKTPSQCIEGAQLTGYSGSEESDPCSGRSQSACSGSLHYHLGKAFQCNWWTSDTQSTNPIPLISVAGCTVNTNIVPKLLPGNADNDNCLKRTNQSACTDTPYYSNEYRYICQWDPTIANQQQYNPKIAQ